MKTFLVPVDFSATAKNSAIYAAALAKNVGATKLVLYNAYSIPLATEMSWAILQTEELQKASEEGLNIYKEMLQPIAGDGITIETMSDFGFLQERIAEVADTSGADLIVMGITGGGKLEEVVIGSNTTHVVQHTHVPVLIVPGDANFKPIQKVGWACDYKDILRTTPAETIKKVLDNLGSSLVVVHNEEDPNAFDPEKFHNNVLVAELFSRQQARYVSVVDKDFSHAIDQFIADNQIDMMLIVPKKHSWISSLFNRSHTTRLAFHTHVPLLCVQAL